MYIVFNNGGKNQFTFTEKWCRSTETETINYYEDNTTLFDVIDISLNEKPITVKRTVEKKKLFKTIIEEVEETVIIGELKLEYKTRSRARVPATVVINIAQEEMQDARDVVKYIMALVNKTRAEIEEKERAEKEEQTRKIIKEKERLSRCKYDYVVIDFETTGIKSPFDGEKYDEVLSVSIIDQDGNILLNSLCKPQRRKTWAKAQEIHGITPAMVKDQPAFEELFPKVKEILYDAKIVLAYNIEFEMNFLWGFDLEFGKPGGTQLINEVVWGPDPMLMYSAYKGNERWQKLSSAAKHFKYKFDAHDSLEDVKATSHVYKCILDYVKENEDKDYIIKYGYLYDGGRKGKWLDLMSYSIISESDILK